MGPPAGHADLVPAGDVAQTHDASGTGSDLLSETTV